MSNEPKRDPRDARIQKLEERQNDMIHKAELRELIDQWRSYARQYGSHQRDTFNARCETYDTCADELEELLE